MASSQPVIRSGILRAVRRYLTDNGVSYEELAAHVGLPLTDGEDPLRPMPLNAMMEMFALISHRLGDPVFGVALGRSLQPGDAGLIGELLMTAPSAREGFKSVGDFIRVFMSPFEVDYLEEGGTGGLEWSYPPDATASRVQFNLFIFCSLTVALRNAVGGGPDWAPLLVQMDHAPPVDASDSIRAVLGSRVRYDAPRNRLTVDATTLASRMPRANPPHFAMARNLAGRILADEAPLPEIVARTRQVIGEMLSAGQPELGEVAGRLDIGQGALQWRLERSGTTFEKVLAEVRRARAESQLRNSDKPLTEIAYELGFSDLSAFSRAARRWFKMSPSDFRKQARGRQP